MAAVCAQRGEAVPAVLEAKVDESGGERSQQQQQE